MSVDSATQRARRELLKKEGVCVDCRRSKAKKFHTLCQACMDERSARYLETKAKREAFVEEKGSIVDRKMEIAERLYRLRKRAA